MPRNLRDEIAKDKEAAGSKDSATLLKRKYAEALRKIKTLEQRQEQIGRLRDTGVSIHKILPQEPQGKSEATAIWVASDWHVEENVDPRMVGGLNHYNMAIAKSRSETFFRSALRITNILARDVNINTVVFALLGDFFSNDIHDELLELNETQPVHAAIYAQDLLASGIQYVLDNSKYSLIIPCHSGNHGRVTDKVRFSVESGHSLEYFMYRFLESHFKGNPRVKFLVAQGYHSYLKIYDQTIRFHHGHATKYGGGVGGITIPMNKAIAQWDKAIRADISICGHYHQFFDGGNFIANGSMIGYNAYALSIKASFEKPKQALLLIDKKRGKTCVWPILFD